MNEARLCKELLKSIRKRQKQVEKMTKVYTKGNTNQL